MKNRLLYSSRNRVARVLTDGHSPRSNHREMARVAYLQRHSLSRLVVSGTLRAPLLSRIQGFFERNHKERQVAWDLYWKHGERNHGRVHVGENLRVTYRQGRALEEFLWGIRWRIFLGTRESFLFSCFQINWRWETTKAKVSKRLMFHCCFKYWMIEA